MKIDTFDEDESMQEEEYQVIDYSFDKYDIQIRLNHKNQFVDVISIKIKKDFLDYKRRTGPKKFVDVEKYY